MARWIKDIHICVYVCVHVSISLPVSSILPMSTSISTYPIGSVSLESPDRLGLLRLLGEYNLIQKMINESIISNFHSIFFKGKGGYPQ